MPVFHISGGDTSLGSKDEKKIEIDISNFRHTFYKTEKHRKKAYIL